MFYSSFYTVSAEPAGNLALFLFKTWPLTFYIQILIVNEKILSILIFPSLFLMSGKDSSIFNNIAEFQPCSANYLK